MNGTCEICYQVISASEERYFCNHCGQDFHKQCIETALTKDRSCPMCKEPFTSIIRVEESTQISNNPIQQENQASQVENANSGNLPKNARTLFLLSLTGLSFFSLVSGTPIGVFSLVLGVLFFIFGVLEVRLHDRKQQERSR